MTTDHRATTSRPSDRDQQAATPSGSVIGPLDPQSAAHLTTSRGFPCISVLMPTTPGSRMTTSDATRLAGLLEDVERQLEEHGVMQSARLLAALGHLARSAQHSRAADSWEIQMLYGIRPDEQRRLAAGGTQVRAYVPYGSDWYAYFMRRLAERPANVGFFLRSLATKS